MSSVQLPLSGQCQCGSLRYSLSKAPLLMYCCHCTNCQKQTGSAFVLSMAIYEDSLSFTEGEPTRFTWNAESGTERFGMLCGNCGTRIANGQVPSNGLFSLRAGTLDDTSWLRPAGHIWMRSAQPWFRPEPEDILCEQQPSDYTPLLERFGALHSFSD